MSRIAIAMERSGPQPTTRVGAAVVEAHAGPSFDLSQHRPHTGGIDAPQLALDRHHQPAVLAQHHGTDISLGGERRRLIGCRVPAVNEPAGDVDAHQLPGAVVPHGSLAEVVGAEHGDRGGRVVGHQGIVF